MTNSELARPAWLLPIGRVHPLWWTVVGAAMIWLYYLSGPGTQYPVLYVIPVMLAAWYSGTWAGVALAVAVPLFHIVLLVAGDEQPANLAAVIAATVLRAVVIVLMALWFSRLAQHERAVRRYATQLEGLLPICAFCKSIRNDAGSWESLEAYISARSRADFSHGLCPTCLRTHYPAM